jgi:hypothetical protein
MDNWFDQLAKGLAATPAVRSRRSLLPGVFRAVPG